MRKLLRDIADIQAGYQFRRKVIPDPSGNMRVIQMKDIATDRSKLQATDLVTVKLNKVPATCLARTGDVLFLARGHRLTATLVTRPAEDALVSGYFFILRPKAHAVSPAYLTWFINQSAFQEQLRAVMKGTHTPLVAKADIQNLVVELPSMDRQDKIAKLNDLGERERQLLAALAHKRAELVRAISLHAVHQRS